MQQIEPQATRIACYGVDFRSAPVALRERLVCSAEEIHARAQDAPEEILELALISTCNRHELYAAFPATVSDPQGRLRDLLVETTGVEAKLLDAAATGHCDDAAVEHLARVAAGLESLVLGEPQIIGQVMESYAAAQALGGVGVQLSRLFRICIRAGRRVRHATAISRRPASISSIAITLGEQHLGDLAACNVALLGAGEMAHQALKTLHDRGVDNVMVLNRTDANAERLAAAYKGRSAPWRDRARVLSDIDMVICAVRSDEYVLRHEDLASLQHGAAPRSRLLVDIGLPRTIDPAVGELAGVTLLDLDHLNGRLDETLAARRREIPAAEAIIDEMVEIYRAERRRDTVRPLVASLRRQAESIRRREIERSVRYLGEQATPEMMAQIDHMTRALVNKLLHEPTVRLKAHAEAGDAQAYAATIEELFALGGATPHE